MGHNPPPPPILRPAVLPPPPPPKKGVSEPKIPDWIEKERPKDKSDGWGWLTFALILGLWD